MANKMLIDATHSEETRVVVCKGTRVEEFDLESQERRQLKGNIYLAKVTRVEPSLQAAFVDYGGNRHGFLAFSEIHPDYYQIPYSDRQVLLKEAAEAEARANETDAGDAAREAAERREAPADANGEGETGSEAGAEAEQAEETPAAAETEVRDDPVAGDDADDAQADDAQADDDGGAAETSGEAPATEARAETPARGGSGRRPRRRRRSVAADAEAPVLRERVPNGGGDEIESVGAEDVFEELPDRQVSRRRQYKIQEVIRRRQILLVQVVKEERGTKGAALTTYLSLAGRYCVLMPNTARGGGISRKITSLTDRRRLKSIAGDLKVADGTGVIVRTAGADRTKAEIKRDFEYLQRLWESIRTLTLKSTAPSLIYEEGSLIKRSIRDLYNKDVDEVLVEGDEGYREAKAFMRMLMPSHARHVKQYKETEPLFVRHRIESQLDDMFSPVVTLKSGGYLVINQTEALVAIDVNSGKATREHNVEDTALQTNLEAAAEIARQLRLRDLAGLVVLDFIDMEERRNNRSVERRIKECLKTDRARIQVGRISHFGLLEMSRQRIRASVIEGTMQTCEHCHGSGRVRSVSSTALQVVRSLEEMVAGGQRHNLTITSSAEIVLYMLNRKRAHIHEIESRYGIDITIAVDETLRGSKYVIERGALATQPLVKRADSAVQIDTAFDAQESLAEDEADEAEVEAEADSDQPQRRRGRRRGRRSQEAQRAEARETGVAAEGEEEAEPREAYGEAGAPVEAGAEGGPDGESGRGRAKRRRGRRGGRRQRRDETAAVTGESAAEAAPPSTAAENGVAEIADGGGEEASGKSAKVDDAAPATEAPGPAADMTEASGTAPAPAQSDIAAPRPAIAWPWQRLTAHRGDEQPSANGVSAETPAAGGNGAGKTDAEAATAEPDRAEEGEPAGQAGLGGTAGAAREDAADSAPAPDRQRRGWWQRRFAADR